MIKLNSECFYDPDTGYVFKDGEKALRIRGIKSVILLRLLSEEGDDFLSREDLIKNTWGKSSLIVTSSSLTQQIYLLRKELSSIGITDLIISQSKMGYKISHPASKRKGLNSIHQKGLWCKIRTTIFDLLNLGKN